MKKFLIGIVLISLLLSPNISQAMNSSEIMEYEGKIVTMDVLIPATTETVTLYDIEILRVFLHPEQFIPNYYVAVRYNSGCNYKGKIFILPCKYIVYMEEVK